MRGRFASVEGIFSELSGLEAGGYEIHMGEMAESGEAGAGRPGSLLSLSVTAGDSREGTPEKREGCQRGNLYGTYLHGIFDSPGVARCVADALLRRKGTAVFDGQDGFDYKAYRESQYDKLAAVLREHLDMKRIYQILEERRP